MEKPNFSSKMEVGGADVFFSPSIGIYKEDKTFSKIYQKQLMSCGDYDLKKLVKSIHNF